MTQASLDSRPLRLLIVEDEVMLREAVARSLEARGLRVSRAGSLGEALSCLETEGFDAFVLDVGLPDGDGLSLLGRAPAERVLVVSANPDPERYASLGVRHHLPKPLDMRQLAETIEALAAAA